MATQEERREDLLVEATAFQRRILWRKPPRMPDARADQFREVFIGFRRKGGASIFLNQDPVLHFDSDRYLRRLYFAGHRFSAENGRLKKLVRKQAEGRLQFTGKHLEPESEQSLLKNCLDQVQQVLRAVIGGELVLVGQIPLEDQNLFNDSLELLGSFCDGIGIAMTPNA